MPIADSKPAGPGAPPGPSERRSASAYFPLLDSLRGIAALGVFVLHIAFYLGLGAGTGVAEYLVEHVSNYPAPSVVIFFGLSGFVLYRPFVARRMAGRPRETFVEYGTRRAARILPAYWVSLVVTAIVLHRGYVFSGSGLLRYFAFTQVYDQRTFARGAGVAWSLDVEVVFYLVLPLIVLLARALPARSQQGFLRTELAMCAVLYAFSTIWQGLAVHLFLHQPRWFYPSLLSFPGSFDIIVCGMTLAVLSVAWQDGVPGRPGRLLATSPWLPWLVALAAYVLIGQIPAGFLHRHAVLGWVLTKQLRCLIAVGALVPLIFGVEGGGWLRAMLASRPMRFLGAISYGFYLWHWAVINELVRQHADQRWGDVAFVAVALMLSLGLASLSWFCLERPIVRGARRWLARHGPTREPPSVLDPPAAIGADV